MDEIIADVLNQIVEDTISSLVELPLTAKKSNALNNEQSQGGEPGTSTMNSIEEGLRNDTNTVMRILADEKGPQLDRDEVSAYLEAHLMKRNRVQIVTEELLGMVVRMGEEEIRPHSPQLRHGPPGISGKWKGNGKGKKSLNAGVSDKSLDDNLQISVYDRNSSPQDAVTKEIKPEECDSKTGVVNIIVEQVKMKRGFVEEESNSSFIPTPSKLCRYNSSSPEQKSSPSIPSKLCCYNSSSPEEQSSPFIPSKLCRYNSSSPEQQSSPSFPSTLCRYNSSSPEQQSSPSFLSTLCCYNSSSPEQQSSPFVPFKLCRYNSSSPEQQQSSISSNCLHLPNMSPISKLPVEVLELILSQMPLQELLLSHSLVCKQWRDIIQRKTFLPSRKSYHEYKLGSSITKDRLEKMVEEEVAELKDTQGLNIIQEIKQTSLSKSQAMLKRCLPWLLKKYSKPNNSPYLTSVMLDSLHNHPRYSLCKLILQDMFPDLTISSMSLLIMILCTTTNKVDCSKAIELLVCRSTPFTKIYVEEFLYELCTYLKVFERLYSLPPFTQHTLYLSLATHQHTSLTVCKEETMLMTWWASYCLWLKCLIGQDMRQKQGEAIKYDHELMLLTYFKNNRL